MAAMGVNIVFLGGRKCEIHHIDMDLKQDMTERIIGQHNILICWLIEGNI